MKWSLYTVIPQIIISPGYSEQIYGDINKFFILDTEKPIKLKHNNKDYLLSPDFIVIGSAITIVNDLSTPVNLKIITFNSVEQQEACSPIILSKTDISVKQFLDSLKKVLENILSYSETKDEELCYEFSKFFENTTSFTKDRKKSVKIDPRLIWIHRIIRTQYHEPLTLEALAKKVHCNSVYLSNTFSKVFKCSPMKHLQRVRMNKAQQLLSETDLSINEITKSIGYVSRSQFADYFKKHHGITPSKYRRNMRIRKEEIESWQ